jgi:hypothetical protein
MDNSVALVQAYLRLNGYFTVSELPVIASTKGGGYRTATDLDILALRFPRAGRITQVRDEVTRPTRNIWIPTRRPVSRQHAVAFGSQEGAPLSMRGDGRA